MDDATSSPSDSSSTTATAATPKTTAADRSFAPKPRRLARGLNDLFARQAAAVRPGSRLIEVETAEGQTAAEKESATGDVGKGDVAKKDVVKNDVVTTEAGARSEAASGLVAVEASAAPTGYEYRFVQLISRLDATCNLLADARQTHLVAAQRTGRIAWAVAAGLALVTGIALWWAGSIAAWNGAQLEYEQTRSSMIEKNLRSLTEKNAVVSKDNETLSEQQRKLAQSNETLRLQSESIRAEVETIRSALGKANLVIDELMSKPEEQ